MTLLNGILAYAAPLDPGAGAEGSIGGLLFYVILGLSISFTCSILEAILLSSSPSYIELIAKQGRRSGVLMQSLKQNVERPISAILTLNTIAHTVGAAGAGAQATAVFGNEFFGIISAVLTLLILVLSEIIPKTLGAVYWKPLMPFGAYTMHFLVIALYPFVWIFEVMTRRIRPEEEEPTVTRSELEAMAQIGREEGTLEEKENRILSNLLQLQNVQVYNIMTPRTVVMALQQESTVGEIISKYRVLPYSRIPIYAENADDIIAYVLRHDIFYYAARDQHEIGLKSISRPIHAVPETNSVAKVLDEFIAKQEHIFLVFDEYGGTSGIITLEDTIESLLGIEITDESDTVTDLRQLAQQRYDRQLELINQMSIETPENTPASDDQPETEQPS